MSRADTFATGIIFGLAVGFVLTLFRLFEAAPLVAAIFTALILSGISELKYDLLGPLCLLVGAFILGAAIQIVAQVSWLGGYVVAVVMIYAAVESFRSAAKKYKNWALAGALMACLGTFGLVHWFVWLGSIVPE